MTIEIVEFEEKWAADFGGLNYEWIEKFFAVEKHDREILDDPKKFVLEPGGQIFIAAAEGVAAGTVAMIPAGDGVVELTKMAVSPNFNGLVSVTARSNVVLTGRRREDIRQFFSKPTRASLRR